MVDIGEGLAAVGQSNLPQTLGTALNYIQGKKRLALEGRRLTMMDERQGNQERRANALFEQDIQIKTRQNKLAEEQEAQANAPLGVNGLTSRFYGGEQGSVAKYATNFAASLGYIGKDPTGKSSVIKRKHAQEVFKAMHEPQHAAKLSLLRIQDATEQLSQVDAKLNDKEKPPTGTELQKLTQQKQQMEQTLNAFMGEHEGLQKELKRQAEEKEAEAALTEQGKSDIIKERQIEVATETPTQLQKEYDRFKQNNPTYQGSLIDFNKDKNKKSLRERAVAAAGKDVRLLLPGEKGRTLSQLTEEYMEAYKEESNLTVEGAREYLRKAGGNRKLAEQRAKKDGKVF